MMYPKSYVFGIAATILQVATTLSKSIKARDLDSFVSSQATISLQGALNNIGPNGSAVAGAGNYVVASPSKANPDYFYTWSRDSALTLKMIIDEVIYGDESLQSQIHEYIMAQARLQTISNPTGTFLPDGVGLGEPKYTVDGQRFNEDWGRPQRDGPALRAIALMSYSDHLLSSTPTSDQNATVQQVIWPIIANDLAYVGQYWNSTGFDLWEETNGSSFFTIQNQHRALVQGTSLSAKLGVSCPACESQQSQILCFLQSFWNGKFITANTNLMADNGRSGIDANTILGPIAVFDVEVGCEGETFQPCESKSLANFKVFVDTFRGLYSINAGISNDSGIALGRYPEDVYMGGNPWYLITLAASEFLYDAIAQWKYQNSLQIDSTSLTFFQTIYPSATPGTYTPSSASNDIFSSVLSATRTYADSFLSIAQKYIPADGSLAEQFDKSTGLPVSAYDLTWSYASFVTMSRRYNSQYPPCWGAATAIAPPDTCTPSTLRGTYEPAVMAGAPNVTVEELCQVQVTWNINATTYVGENLYLVGNVTELGMWDVANGQAMGAGGYSEERPLWDVRVGMEAGQMVGYNFVRVEDCGQEDVWESVERVITIPSCGSSALTLEDSWEGDVGASGNCSS